MLACHGCSAIGGSRPTLPIHIPDMLRTLIHFAWTRHPIERLTLEDFHEQLTAVTSKLFPLECLTTTVVDGLP